MTHVNELTLKYTPKQPLLSDPVTTPHEAHDFLRGIWNDMIGFRESFYVVLLDAAKNIRGYHQVSVGGSTATIVDPVDCFRPALLSPCNSIVLAHNHPSGQMRESRADINLTKRLVEIGKLLNIPVDDHIILMGDSDRFVSFRMKGLI